MRGFQGIGSGLSGLSGMIGAGGGLTTRIRDQFTDANGTALGSHAIAPTNTPAAAWLIVQGGFDIQSNQCNATGAQSRARCDAGVADATVRGDAVAIGGDSGRHGLVLRCTDASNFWFACFIANSNQFEITERNGGAVTVRASVGVTITGGNTYALEAVLSGTTITATIDGANQISYGSATLNQTTALHGVATNQTNARVDNFEVAA